MEVKWMTANGLTRNYADAVELPAFVIEDARLVMEAEAVAARKAAHGG